MGPRGRGSPCVQWGPMGRKGKNNLGDSLSHFYGKHVLIIGLKAPGNYFADFGLIFFGLLREGPTPPNSMIYGLLDPSETVFMDLNIPSYFLEYKKV